MKIVWRAILAALFMIFFGFLISGAGYSVIREWHSIRLAYAACGVTWILAGPVVFVAGCWLLGSAGRKRTPWWIGGAACTLAGSALVLGVLTHVIPCSSPS